MLSVTRRRETLAGDSGRRNFAAMHLTKFRSRRNGGLMAKTYKIMILSWWVKVFRVAQKKNLTALRGRTVIRYHIAIEGAVARIRENALATVTAFCDVIRKAKNGRVLKGDLYYEARHRHRNFKSEMMSPVFDASRKDEMP